MQRLSRQYVESVCEFWGLTLIRHDKAENGKRSSYCYSVIDGEGNYLTRKQDLKWAFMFVHDYVHNTKDLGITTWICPKCRQINFSNEVCLECRQQKSKN